MKKLIILLFIFCVSVINVNATGITSYTISPTVDGTLGITQDAYYPNFTITTLGLDSASEMAFGNDGYLYIADTGNKRIVIFDTENSEIINELTYEEFQKPMGIFVTDEIYVADSAAESIFVFDLEGELIKKINKPTSPSYGNTNFNPKRIAVDNRKNMYIVSEGVYNGIIQLSNNGEFLGYFTSNKVRLSIKEMLQQLLFTEEQKEELDDKVPVTFSNINIDNRGLLYSTTMGSNVNNPVKKHNTAGENMLDHTWGVDDTVIDIDIDSAGIIYTAYQTGYISVLTSEGRFIHAFGGSNKDNDVSGLFSSLQAISVDSNNDIWALDGDKGYLQSFTATEYANKIYDALESYERGEYQENIDKWSSILKQNQASLIAHYSIGKNYLFLQNYEKAMEHFEISDAKFYFSEAFWEIRNTWLQENLALIIGLLVLYALVIKIIRIKYKGSLIPKQIRDLSKIKFIKDILFSLNFIKHPIDSFYDLKRNRQGSSIGATSLYVIFFTVFLWYTYGKGFIFQFVRPDKIDIAPILLGYFSIFGLFIICNYLVTSINDGDGKLIDIYKLVAYSLAPIILGISIITILSYILTFNEIFILSFILNVSILWTLIYVLLGVQETHNYRTRDAFKSILITILFIIIIIVVLLIVFMMANQLYDFVISIIKEVWRNVS